jgi:AcrR family transcriptional regulator
MARDLPQVGDPEADSDGSGGVRAERSRRTRRLLLATARELFAERGYAAVGTEEIVRRSGLTRGALYHHFDRKRDLFREVFEEMERELTERVATDVLASRDPAAGLVAGLELFLDACLEPDVQRIGLVDAPAVLGWDEWHEIEARHGLGLIEAGLRGAMDAGQITEQPVAALAHVLLGAMIEAGLYVARAEDRQSARAEMSLVLRRLIDGLRPPEPGDR